MFFILCFVLTCIIQCILNYFRILLIPINVFILTIGFIWGTVVHLNPELEKYSHYITYPPQNYGALYVPIMVFRIAFCLDSTAFQKAIPQILVIAVPVTLLTGIITGSIMRFVIAEKWTPELGVLFGMLCCPTYPVYVVRLIKTIATKTKYVEILLEGEAIFNATAIMIMNLLIMGYFAGIVTKWYHFVTLTLRFIILGVLSGYVAGKLGCCILRNVYDDVFGIVAIMSALPLVTYSVVQHHLSGDGVLSVLIVGLMLGNERATLSKTLDTRLTDTWMILSYLLEYATTIYISTILMVSVGKHIKPVHFPVILVLYVLYYFVRFSCYTLFLPILRKLGFGLNFRNMLVVVWGGTKNSLSLLYVVLDFHYNYLPEGSAEGFFFYLMILLFLSYLINATMTGLLLKYLGLTEISTSRQINMNSCMKQIYEKRDQVIAILKMDRFLADTNWSMVVVATNIQHPYRTKLDVEDEVENFFLGYRYTSCPDCQRELVGRPTNKELEEMKKEAKMRILKTRKISYSRQYENGMVSKEGVRFLTQAVELALDTEAEVINMADLYRKINQENCIDRFVKKRLHKIEDDKLHTIRPPRNQCRRFCYRIVMYKNFDGIIYMIVLLNMIPISLHTYYYVKLFKQREYTTNYVYTFVGIETCFFVIYLLEFVVKILAFSWTRIKEGYEMYFSSCWDTLDFVILCIIAVDVFTTYGRIASGDFRAHNRAVWIFSLILEVMRYMRVLKFVRICATIYPKLIRMLDTGTNKRLTHVYELGKAYAAGEGDVLETLPSIVNHAGIREELKKEIEENKVNIVKLLGLVQKERPWIAITVKTKQAIRTILSRMKEAITQLKVLGWANEYEHALLRKELGVLYRQVGAIKSVRASAPKVIFKEVPWMGREEEIIDFLFSHVTVKKFEPGDVVIKEGTVAQGVYIVVTGLLMLTYVPNPKVLEDLEESGRLPIVDYISSSQYRENVVDYIVSGNCVGEMSTLTGRPYHCTITAVTHTQVYGLSHSVMKEAMKLSSDPVNGLECRMWKAESIRIAVSILMTVPAYHSLRQEQIKYSLARAFVPDLSYFKVFIVNDMMQDVILIEGSIADYNSRELYIAPCYIPRTVQKMILPTSSFMNIASDVATKMLIIPEVDVDENDVMLMAEETCELVTDDEDSNDDTRNRAARIRNLKSKGGGKRKRMMNYGSVAGIKASEHMSTTNALDEKRSSN